MIFYCTDHGRFWSLFPTAKTVLRAPKRVCPTCVKAGRIAEEEDED